MALPRTSSPSSSSVTSRWRSSTSPDTACSPSSAATRKPQNWPYGWPLRPGRQALRPGTRLVKAIGDAVMLTADAPQVILATITAPAAAAAGQDGFIALRAGIDPLRQRSRPRRRPVRARGQRRRPHHRPRWRRPRRDHRSDLPATSRAGLLAMLADLLKDTGVGLPKGHPDKARSDRAVAVQQQPVVALRTLRSASNESGCAR